MQEYSANNVQLHDIPAESLFVNTPQGTSNETPLTFTDVIETETSTSSREVTRGTQTKARVRFNYCVTITLIINL